MIVPGELDPANLAEVGWAAVVPTSLDPNVRAAIEPLLELRREQAGSAFRVLECRPGESAQSFLARYGASLGQPATPDRVPAYLSIVGGPAEVSFDTENKLSLSHAVGRIAFESPDEYGRYAAAVVECDSRPSKSQPRAVLFCPDSPQDVVLTDASRWFVAPLVEAFTTSKRAWEVRWLVGEYATREALLECLGGGDTPDLLLTLTHGLTYPAGDALQNNRQGSLACFGGGALGPAVSGEDIPADADLRGLIGLHLASFSAGTPQIDSLGVQIFNEKLELAPSPRMSRLPQRLLSVRRPTLAVIGLVDRLVLSGPPDQRWEDLTTIARDIVARLRRGERVGSAVGSAGLRWAQLASELAGQLQRASLGLPTDDALIASLWARKETMRSFSVLGDPAVRLLDSVAS